ncbi:hypothetical protein CCP3SC5AM1_1240004 [Gammaproteobacteria bacterium]
MTYKGNWLVSLIGGFDILKEYFQDGFTPLQRKRESLETPMGSSLKHPGFSHGVV